MVIGSTWAHSRDAPRNARTGWERPLELAGVAAGTPGQLLMYLSELEVTVQGCLVALIPVRFNFL